MAEKPSKAELAKKSVEELRALARKHGVANADSMGKDELITALDGIIFPDLTGEKPPTQP